MLCNVIVPIGRNQTIFQISKIKNWDIIIIVDISKNCFFVRKNCEVKEIIKFNCLQAH